MTTSGRGFGRRRFLQGAGVAAGAAALGTFPAPAVIAQTRNIRFTLPWLAQGATAYVYIANELGLFRRRGLNVEISRGFGSGPAAQTIAQGQFDFGMVGAGPLILTAARGLPITALGTINYDMTMGVAVLADSPIRTPKDLEGKRIGAVPTSAEFPFWPAYARAAGIDTSGITIVQMDNRVLERSLIDRQVDAITAVGSSSIPVIMSQGARHRYFLYSGAGLNFYANAIATRPETLQNDPALCEAVVDAIVEAVVVQLREPDRALDLFIRQVPEIGITQGGRENARLSQGMMQFTMLAPEAIENGIGWTDMARWNQMTDLVVEAAPSGDIRRPAAEATVTNRFAGKTKLPAAEWQTLRTRLAEFGALLA